MWVAIRFVKVSAGRPVTQPRHRARRRPSFLEWLIGNNAWVSGTRKQTFSNVASPTSSFPFLTNACHWLRRCQTLMSEPAAVPWADSFFGLRKVACPPPRHKVGPSNAKLRARVHKSKKSFIRLLAIPSITIAWYFSATTAVVDMPATLGRGILGWLGT